MASKMVALAKLGGIEIELLELVELREVGGTPVRWWRRSGEGSSGVSAKIERGGAPLFIGEVRQLGEGKEREIGSGLDLLRRGKEGEEERKEKGVGVFERAVGPARQREKRGGRAIGGRSERSSDLTKRSWAGSYSNWASIRFRFKNFFLIFKNRKENKEKENVGRVKYRGIIYQNAQKNKCHLMDIFARPK